MTLNRMDRINELIKRQLGLLFLRELDLPHESFVTVTEVRTTNDLSACTIYISVTPGDAAKEILALLQKRRGFFRHELSQQVILRKMPEVRFELDMGAQKAARIEELLDKIIPDDKPASDSSHEPL